MINLKIDSKSLWKQLLEARAQSIFHEQVGRLPTVLELEEFVMQIERQGWWVGKKLILRGRNLETS